MPDTQQPAVRMPMTWADKMGIDIRSFMAAKANDPTGGPFGAIRIVVPDGATGDIEVGPIPVQFRIIDAVVLKTVANGGAVNTVQILNNPISSGAIAVTNAMSINVNDQTIVRPTTIDDVSHDIVPGSNIRVTRTKAGGNAACIVTVLGYRT